MKDSFRPRGILRFAAASLWLLSFIGLPETGPRAAHAQEGAPSWISAGEAPRTLADLRLLQEQMQEVSSEVLPVTVGLRLGPVEGSGVIVNKEGYILTAAHVIGSPRQDVTVILPDGREVQGETLGMSRGLDAGLARILDPPPDENGWPHAAVGSSDRVTTGQWVVATGHPGGYQGDRGPVVRMGRVLSRNESIIVTDCTLIGGDSGGPLFDMTGKVIGVHSRIGSPLTANLHVPVSGYRDAWERMVRGDAWGHLPGFEPFIGVQGEKGASVARLAYVYPDSPAEDAGIRVGDVITAFDGHAVKNFDDLVARVSTKTPGDRVRLEVLRRNVTLDFELVVGRREG